MHNNKKITVILPALDEEASVGVVIKTLLLLKNTDDTHIIDDIIVCDNGSNDNTSKVASDAGARVIYEERKGYGIACLTAMSLLNDTDIVLFVDADQSVRVEESVHLLQSIHEGNDLVVGVRVKEQCQYGALTLPQKYGNLLATRLIKLIWGQPVSDLGPFRAIRFDSLCQLNMCDQAYGWTVEMQVKAIQYGMNIAEVPVSSIKRIGQSKISGSMRGVFAAGSGIIGKIVVLLIKEKIMLLRSKIEILINNPK